LELGAWDLTESLDISPRRLSSIRPSRSPSEPRRPRVRAALDDIGDERAQDGRELQREDLMWIDAANVGQKKGGAEAA